MDKESVYRIIGASNHSKTERQSEDFYATDPVALDELLKVETFNKYIWEPACGDGSLSKALLNKGYVVRNSDIVDRGCPNTEIIDFLNVSTRHLDDGNKYDIITNPPYKYATEFLTKALDISPVDTKIAMFLKLTFLESEKRYKVFKDNPPKNIYVFSKRIACGINGDFFQHNSDGSYKLDQNGNKLKIGSAVAYAWFVWQKGYRGKPSIDWVYTN